MRRALLIASVLLGLCGCFPGGEGWECSTNADCKPPMECRALVAGGTYCLSPHETRIRSSSRYWWPKLILFWLALTALVAGVLGIAILAWRESH